MVLNVTKVKAFCKAHGRRVGKDFLEELEIFVQRKLDKACKAHNGGKVTLDQAVANYVGITRFGG